MLLDSIGIRLKLKVTTAKSYGENRYIAYGKICERLMVQVFTLRGEAIRIISLRKAKQREVNKYDH